MTTCRERKLTLDHIQTFLTPGGHGGPPRMKDQLNAGATYEQHKHERRYIPSTHPFILSFFLLSLFTLPQSRTYTHRDFNPNARGSDACKGSICLWTRTLGRYTRAGLPECVVNTMLGPPPETARDRTQRRHTQSQDRN